MDSASPVLSFEQPWLRRTILAAYWAVVLLAVPIWWSTTSIERLALPTSRVQAETARRLHFPLTVVLDSADFGAHTISPASLQSELQTLVGDIGHDGDGLVISVANGALNDPSTGAATYHVHVAPGRTVSTVHGRRLAFSGELDTAALPATLSNLLSPYKGSDYVKHARRTAQYAPRYRLAFSLLNEDGAAGKAALDWDIRSALHRYVSPVSKRLHALHNFTTESQVQFQAPLAVTPREVQVEEGIVHGLSPEDLTVFINSAEWTLSSGVSEDPVLHFVLFIPSVAHRPLRILDSTGMPTESDAFILPQWGGVVIWNPPTNTPDHFHLDGPLLEPAFSIFRSQLLALLGVPALPEGVVSADENDLVTDWQLDALLRHRAIENTEGSKETLDSIVKLVDQIENMPVGPGVKNDVQGALSALEKMYAAAQSSPGLALLYSSQALTLASRAFFNPGMLALLYFPAEHKYAVYTPLFAPVAVPLIAAAAREFRAWKRSRRGGTVAAPRLHVD